MSNPFEASGTKKATGGFKAAPAGGSHPVKPSPLVTDRVPAELSTKKKKGFFARLFGGSSKGETPLPPIEPKPMNSLPPKSPTVSTPGAPSTAPVTKSPVKMDPKPQPDVSLKQHEELIQSVNEISKALESSKAQQVEVSVKDMVTPIPVENIDELTKVQKDVSGVLEKVAGRLEEAGSRDSKVIESLSKMDGTLLTMSRSSEKSLELAKRSITSMDGVKGAMGNVSTSMETMKSELENSGKRYEELCEKMKENEKVHADTLVTLQKRTLWVNVVLGLSLIAGLVAVIAQLAK